MRRRSLVGAGLARWIGTRCGPGREPQLARLLRKRGNLDELRRRADNGDEAAPWRLAELLAERGDLDELRARADNGDWAAARKLTELLADHADLDGAVQIVRARADAGERHAASRLVELLAMQGRGEEAERLSRFGLNPDGSIACA